MVSIQALNGSDVFIRVFNQNADAWQIVGGQLTHSESLTNQPIDVTHKQNGNVREFMDGEGLRTLDLTLDVIFSTDVAFDYIKQSFVDKTIERYEIINGLSDEGDAGTVDFFSSMVTAFAETSPDNDKTSASVTFTSTSVFAQELTYQQFQTVLLEDFHTSNSEQFLVRIT